MIKCIQNTKGAGSVFLCFMFMSLIIVVAVTTEIICEYAAKTTRSRTVELASRSVLSEYDTYLYDQYGIFAIATDEKTVESKAEKYVKTTLGHSSEKVLDIVKLRLEQIEIDLKSFALIDLDNFEEQISKAVQYKIIEDTAKRISQVADAKQLVATKEDEAKRAEIAAKEWEKNQEDAEQTKPTNKPSIDIEQIKKASENKAKEAIDDEAHSTKILKNEKIINALPSRLAGIRETAINLDVPKPSSIAINEYILKYCNYHLSNDDQSFFRNEAEYILFGNLSDEANYKGFKAEFMVMRTALNLAYIYKDNIMRQELFTLASSLTPGPAVAITQLVLATAWAGAESAQDLKTIEGGNSVPLLKTKISWQISIENLLAGNLDGRSAANEEGLDYREYLRIFLYAADREVKLLRMMDIIQINMKGRFNSTFDIRDYYIGFEITAKADRKNFASIARKDYASWVHTNSAQTY